jgi:hypothetical protein
MKPIGFFINPDDDRRIAPLNVANGFTPWLVRAKLGNGDQGSRLKDRAAGQSAR